ncbi:hypothetical protein P3T35_007106 [Kitasatospora sp. GP30]|uniref:hypothetical protein n=1 Tax=Kitasatospora sp. GP30 TaxID=3035084 RepID=UPI000CAEA801|nr:hypothetical protein [Kitasatospora sp. GP30]MDH6145056.1 hypothetical protein [Kitasatospora sp. GP30]
MIYKVARRLLSFPKMLLHRDTARDAELPVLRHENAVLRRQIAGPVRYELADRFWRRGPRRRWTVCPLPPVRNSGRSGRTRGARPW